MVGSIERLSTGSSHLNLRHFSLNFLSFKIMKYELSCFLSPNEILRNIYDWIFFKNIFCFLSADFESFDIKNSLYFSFIVSSIKFIYFSIN